MLRKLKARLAAIMATMEAIIAAADAENSGTFTADQRDQFDALVTERDEVRADIERLEDAARFAQPMDPGTGRTPAGSGARVTSNLEDDPMRGFAHMGEFAAAVRRASARGSAAIVDPRLLVDGRDLQAAPTNFHRETESTDGYMVPPAMREQVWRAVFSEGELLDLVAPEPTVSNIIMLPTDDSTPWGATGVQANWEGEGEKLDPSRLSNNMRTVQLHKLYTFVTATEELVDDAPRLQNRLQVQAPEAIRWKASEAIMTGNNVRKPLGWMNSGALITVTKESGQAAETVVAENIAKMFARLLWTGARDPFWLVNPDTLPQLMTLKIGDQAIWTPNNGGFANAPGGLLLGRPLRFSEHAEALGTKGDIQLIAPNGYYAATRETGIDFAASMHLFFDYDIQAFRWTFRMGGTPYLTTPQAAAKGSSKSHFVVLENRA